MPIAPPCIRHDGDAWIVRGPLGLRGVLTPPADKSLAHRALILASLSTGVCHVRGLSGAEDVGRTLAAMRCLGVRMESEAQGLCVHGVGTTGLHAAPAALECGNSGTTMRLLAGLLAAQPFASRLVGDASLSRRPMRRLSEPLAAMGARVHGLGPDGRPPLQVEAAPARLRGIEHRLTVDSAQVRSALLLAGLYADGPTRLRPAGAARDHLERLLAALGVRVTRDADGLVLEPPRAPWTGFDFDVPGDLSAAAFFVAWAMQPGTAGLRVERVGLNPGRRRYLEVLQDAGATLSLFPGAGGLGEPAGAFEVRGPLQRGLELGGADVVRCIDEIPALVVSGAVSGVAVRVHDAAELRVKESDRIAGLAKLLRGFGAELAEHADGLWLAPGTRLRPAHVSADGDHRLAMAGAILAAAASGDSRIEGVGCVRTSYPDFAADFARLASR